MNQMKQIVKSKQCNVVKPSFVKELISESASDAIGGLKSVKQTTKEGFKWLRNK